VANFPVIVLFGLADQHTPFDDAVLERIKTDTGMFFRQDLDFLGAIEPAPEIHKMRVQPFHMVGIDGIFHRLQPVEIEPRLADVAQHVTPDKHVKPGQQGRRQGAHVHKHQATEFLCRIGADAHGRIEARFSGLFHATAILNKPPAVVTTTDARLLDHRHTQVGPAVRTVLFDHADDTVAITKHHQILAQQTARHGLAVQFCRRHDGHPVPPQQIAHRRTRTHAGEPFVFFGSQHGAAPLTRMDSGICWGMGSCLLAG